MMETNEGKWVFCVVAVVGLVAIATLFALGGFSRGDALLPTGNVIASSCMDSDGGKNLFEKGTVKLPYASHNKKREVLTDKCVGTYKIIEYSCKDATYKKEVLACENGCLYGACLRSTR